MSQPRVTALDRSPVAKGPRALRSRAAARTPAPIAAVVRQGGRALPYTGLAALSLVQAWEWLFSGLSKIQNKSFVEGFMGYVAHTRGGYGQALRAVVMSGPTLVPRIVELSELGIGLLLLAAAVAVLVPNPRLRLAGVIAAGFASLVGATIAINVQLTLGGAAPWRLSRAPFGPGVPIEALLAGVSLAALVQSYASYRMARQELPGT